MAFDAKNFVLCSKFPLFKAESNLWLYSTGDTLEDCLVTNYFQPRRNLKNQDSPDVGDVIQVIVEHSKLAYLKVTAKTEKPYNITVARTYLENEANLLALITELQLDKAAKATDFVTPITDENLGITQTEQTQLEEKIDLAANSGRMITDQGVWYAKMYSATVVPAPVIVGSNYADFSQTDGEGNPIIKLFNAVDTLFYSSKPEWQIHVVGSTFKAKVGNVWGTYVFSYDGADWSLGGNVVNMAEYGITFDGTVTSGDTLSIQYGNWVLDQTITPPADFDGYVPVTSKIWDIAEQDGQQGGRVLWNHTSKQFTPYPTIVSFDSIEITGDSTVEMPATPSDDNIVNVGYVKNTIGTARNIGDIFFTTRKDSGLNGAVECDGTTYQTSDFSGLQSIGNLLALGKIPYVSLSTYATLLTANGSVGVFGWDGLGTTPFRVPSLNDIFVETGTAAQIGNYISAGAPNITGSQGGGGEFSQVTSATGAITFTPSGRGIVDGHTGSSGYNINIDASLSDPVYGNSDTIQPETIRYRAMIQLATSSTDEALETCTNVQSDVEHLKDMSNLTNIGKNIANWSTNTSNCLIEIPQNIKFELSAGVLTLKAGSKCYLKTDTTTPSVTVASDLTTTQTTDGTYFAIYDGSNLTTVLTTAYTYATLPDTYSLPLGVVTVSGGAITSIDNVFNGFGYIGSQVFTLPGVKGLYPNGRNADGTLKNGDINCTSVQVSSSFDDTGEHCLLLRTDGRCQWYFTNQFYYDSNNNVIYTTSGTKINVLDAGVFTTTSGIVSDFKPYTTLKVVDYNELDNIIRKIIAEYL